MSKNFKIQCTLKVCMVKLYMNISIFDNQSMSIDCVGKLGHLFGFLRHYLLSINSKRILKCLLGVLFLSSKFPFDYFAHNNVRF